VTILSLLIVECSNTGKEHRSVRRIRQSAVKRNHGILSAATARRRRMEFLSRTWSPSSLDLFQILSPAVCYAHGPPSSLLFCFHQVSTPISSVTPFLFCSSYSIAILFNLRHKHDDYTRIYKNLLIFFSKLKTGRVSAMISS
jgi:hypothetical protein